MDSIGEVILANENRGSRTLQRLIDDVKRSGVQPTHFLHVSFRFSTQAKKKGSKVRKMLYKLIKNRMYRREIAVDDEIYIKWTTLNEVTSTLYHTTSRFEETYVQQITRQLMTEVFHEILKKL